MALSIGAGWTAPALAGPVPSAVPDAHTVHAVQAAQSVRAAQDTESVVCPVKFSATTAVREIPYADSKKIGEIPAETWADGAWCNPFTTGGNHKTCGYYSNIWVAVTVDDTWGFAHIGCLDDYYLH